MEVRGLEAHGMEVRRAGVEAQRNGDIEAQAEKGAQIKADLRLLKGEKDGQKPVLRGFWVAF